MTNIRKKLVALSLMAAMSTGLTVNAQAGETIKIGYVAGISGPCGGLVSSALNAMKMGVAEINAAGGLLGKEVELIIRDSKTKPAEGAKAARALLLSEEIDVLTGVCSSSVMLAVSAVSKEMKVPLYSTTANTQKANIEAYQPYFWQTQANALMEAVAAAEYVAKNESWKRVALMGFDYEWGHTTIETFTATLKRLRPDMEITEPLFPKLGEKNMTTYIAATLAKQPDVIYAAMFGGGLVSLIKQGNSFGLFEQSDLLSLMTVDAMQSMSNDLPKSGVFGLSRAPFYAMMNNPKVEAFVANYKESYGDYPADWGLLAYDGLMFYAEAVKAANTTEAEALMEAVSSISYDGLRGNNLTVRALDGQMNAPVFVGTVTHDNPYGFPILTDILRFDGDQTLPTEAYVKEVRAKAE